jgi:hypothetical protein
MGGSSPLTSRKEGEMNINDGVSLRRSGRRARPESLQEEVARSRLSIARDGKPALCPFNRHQARGGGGLYRVVHILSSLVERGPCSGPHAAISGGWSQQ